MLIGQVITLDQSFCCRTYKDFFVPIRLKKSDPQPLSVARMFYESLAATNSESQILDFRFQLEGCLLQTVYLSQTRMHVQFPTSVLSESVLCNLKSAIRIVQSIIVLLSEL